MARMEKGRYDKRYLPLAQPSRDENSLSETGSPTKSIDSRKSVKDMATLREVCSEIVTLVLTRGQSIDDLREDVILLDTQIKQLQAENLTLSEQPATYADDNAKLCEQLVEATDNYMEAQKRVNELLQEKMQFASTNNHLNREVDNLTEQVQCLQSKVDNLMIELETQKVLTPEPIAAKKPRTKKSTV